MRRAAKRDANEDEIVHALRKAGWRVIFCYEPMPCDLLAMRASDRGTDVQMIEVKSASGKLRPSQAKAIAEGWPIRVVRGLEDMEDLL